MIQTVYPDSAKDFTVGEALEMHEVGMSVAVNDGKDITVIIEEEK